MIFWQYKNADGQVRYGVPIWLPHKPTLVWQPGTPEQPEAVVHFATGVEVPCPETHAYPQQRVEAVGCPPAGPTVVNHVPMRVYT